MNNCIYVNRNLEVKQSLATALLSKDSTVLSDFANPTKKQGNKYLSILDKIAIIELAIKQAKDPETVELLRQLKQTVKEKGVFYRENPIGSKSHIADIESTNISPLIFRVNTSKHTLFIPILSSELNNLVFNQARAEMFKHTFYSEEDGGNLIVSDWDLNKSLQAYKVHLLNILRRFIIETPGGHGRYIPFVSAIAQSDVDFNEAYKQILKDAWEIIKGKLNEAGSTVLNPHPSEGELHGTINPIAAFYILLNFDDCVRAFGEGTITIRQEYYRKNNINVSDKYFREKQANLPGSFEDMYADTDGDALTSKVLKLFIQSIHLPNGKNLTTEFINKLLIATHAASERDPKLKELFVKLVSGHQVTENNVSDDLNKLQILNLILDHPAVQSRTSPAECKALKNAINSFNDAYIASRDELSSIKERHELPQHYNLLQQLVQCFAKSVMTYSSEDEHGNSVQKTALDYSRSKTAVWKPMQEAIALSLLKGEFYLYDASITLGSGQSIEMISDLYSPAVQQLLRKITGLAFNTASVLTIFSDPDSMQLLGNFIKDLRNTVREQIGTYRRLSEEEARKIAKRVVDILKRKLSYMDVSSKLILGDSSTTIKLLDGHNNSTPIVGTHNTISSHFLNMAETKAWLGNDAHHNIQFDDHLSVLKPLDIDDKIDNQGSRLEFDYKTHITFATDGVIGPKKNKKVIKYKDMTVAQLASVGIFTDYMRSGVLSGVIHTQIEAFSDKVRIAKGAFNADPLLNLEVELDPIKSDDPNGLYTRAYNLHKAYYKKIEQEICLISSQLAAILGYKVSFSTIDQVGQWLEKIKDIKHADGSVTKAEEIYRQLLRKFQEQTGSPINVLRDVHFSIYGNHLGINPSLYKEIQKANTKEYFIQELKREKDEFISDLINEDIDSKEFFDLTTIFLDKDSTRRDRLRKMFGKEAFDKMSKIGQSGGFDATFKNKGKITPDWSYFFEKYFLILSICRESDLLISLKHYWLHDKVENKLLSKMQTHAELQAATKEYFTGLLTDRAKALITENLNRLNKSKKRFNAGPASYTPWDLGSPSGLPSQMKVATIEHARLKVWNYFGNYDELNSHDGAIFSPTVCRVLERNSASNRQVSSSLKTIMLQPSGAGFILIKCADFEMTNSWVRWTKKGTSSSDPEAFDGTEILYKMFSPARLSDVFIQNWRENQKNGLLNLGQDFYYTFLGQEAKLESIQINDDNTFSFKWVYTDPTLQAVNGGIVPLDLVAQSLFTTPSVYNSNGTYNISNLFDLWEAFGGAYCMELKPDGSVGYSDASQEILAHLMSEFDTSGLMKKDLIYKLIDEESSKSSVGVRNTKAQLHSRSEENNFVVQYMDSSRYGIQQDYGHTADGSRIPMLTQVLTAIAFNGENTPIVHRAYEILGTVVEESLAPFMQKWEGDPELHLEFHKYMAKQLLKLLETNSVASNATDIISELVIDMKNWSKENGNVIKTIPYSDPLLFYLQSSHLLTKLNHTSLRHEFDGIAVIQNPANGIVGIYEDVHGVQYTETDITKRANEWLRNNKSFKDATGNDVSPKQLVLIGGNLTLQSINKLFLLHATDSDGVLLFADEVITKDNFNLLNIGDTLLIQGSYQVDEETENGVRRITKIVNNLIVTISDPILFNEYYKSHLNGKLQITKVRSKSRDLATTKISWDSTKATDDKRKPKYVPGNFWLLQSTLQLIKFLLDSKKKGIKKARNVNLEKWHHANLVGLSEPNAYVYATLDEFFANKKTYLHTKVYKKGGEEILPKKYRTELGLGEASMADIRNNPNYFVDLAKRRFTLDSSVDLKKYGKNAVAFVKTNYDIIVTSNALPKDISEDDGSNLYDVPIEEPNTEWQSHTRGDTTYWYLIDLAKNKRIDGIEFTGEQEPNFKVYINRESSSNKTQLIFYTQGINKQSTIQDFWNKFYSGIEKGVNNVVTNYAEHYANHFKPHLARQLDEKQIIELKAKLLRNAFEMSRLTISARIPSQSFQSFLANETVGYTEYDVNDGYMNIWEMWFLGSDYDIDKAYTMMYSLDSTGAIAGNIFTRDALTVEGILKSLLLPKPKLSEGIQIQIVPTAITNGTNVFDIITDFYKLYNPSIPTPISNEQIVSWVRDIKESNDVLYLDLVNAILLAKNGYILESQYNSFIEYVLDEEGNQKIDKKTLKPIVNYNPNLIDVINTYLRTPESMEASKNRIAHTIRHAASDLKNLKASEVPMETGEIGERIEERATKHQKMYGNYSPFTLWRIQRENAIGKSDVGIAANGLKAAGALQLYFDQAYSEGKIPSLRMDLTFDLGKEGPINYRFRRLNNTKVKDLDLFKQLYANEQLPMWDTFAALQPAIIRKLSTTNKKLSIVEVIDLLIADNVSILYTDGLGNYTIPLRNRERRFLHNVRAWVEAGNTLPAYNAPSNIQNNVLAEILYQEMQSEPNVADILSVFISLATDNAKELKLSKMNGRPELLSIPIAMATLGMEVDDIIDICVDMLSVVSKELDAGNSNVRKILQQIPGTNGQSLVRIYDFAQELRALTSFFSVNQGVKARYVELREFLTGLSKQKAEAAVSNFPTVADWGITKHEVQTPIDFLKLFSNDVIIRRNSQGEEEQFTYAQLMVTQYDTVKTGINVMDVVLNSPHFKSQLLAIADTTELIETTTGKGRLLAMISLTDVFDSEKKKDARLTKASLAIRLVDSYLIEEALKKMTHLQFSKDATTSIYDDYAPNVAGSVMIGTLNLSQVQHLLTFVEDSLLPGLTTRFKNNFFLLNILKTVDKKTGKAYYHLPFNAFDADDSLYVSESLNMAMADFEKIAQYSSGLKDLNGQDITIGELIYLYALITSQNSISSMMTCTYSAVRKYSKLPKFIRKEYQEFDELSLKYDKDALKKAEEARLRGDFEAEKRFKQIAEGTAKFNKIVYELYPYIKAQATNTVYKFERGHDNTIATLLGIRSENATLIPEMYSAMKEIVQEDFNPLYSSTSFFLPTMNKGEASVLFNLQNGLTSNDMEKVKNFVITRLALSLNLTKDQVLSFYHPQIEVATVEDQVSFKIQVRFGNSNETTTFETTYTDPSFQLYLQNVDDLITFMFDSLKTPTDILANSKLMNGVLYTNQVLISGKNSTSKILNQTPQTQALLTLFADVKNFATREHLLVLLSNGITTLHYINNLPIMIVSGDINKVSDSDILKLYIMSKGVYSEAGLMIYLMQQLFPEDEIQTVEDIKVALITHKDSEILKNKVISEFIERVYNVSATNYITRHALSGINKYYRALNYRGIYYGNAGAEDKLGDLYLDDDKDEWIQVAVSQDNDPVLVRFTGLTKRPNKENVKILYANERDKFSKKKSLILSPAYLFNSVSLSDFSYEQRNEQQLSESDIKPGVIINNLGDYYFVQDVVYPHTANPSKHVIIRALDMDEMTFYDDPVALLDISTLSSSTMIIPDNATLTRNVEMENGIKVNVDGLPNKASNLSLLKYPSQVILKNGVMKTVTNIDNGFILTSDYDRVSFDDVSTIIIKSMKDIGLGRLQMYASAPELLLTLKKKEVLIYKQSEYKSINTATEFTEYPEFSDGFADELYSTNRNEGSETVITRKAVKTLANGKPVTGFNVRSMHKVDNESDLYVGDYIVIETNGTYEIHQILDVHFDGNKKTYDTAAIIKNGAEYDSETRSYLYDSGTLSYRYGLSLAGLNYSGYSELPRIRTATVQADASIDSSISTKGRRMLEYLASKFNTLVEIVRVDSENGPEAQVLNGKVVIYVPNSVTNIEEYIAEQAVHEFTHLMIAYIRALHPDIYMEIMQSAETLDEFLKELAQFSTSTTYVHETTRKEEALVRIITQSAKGVNGFDLTGNVNYLFLRIIQGFSNKINYYTQDPQGNAIITKSGDFFSGMLDSLIQDNWLTDVATIQFQLLTDKLMDNIRIC